MIIFGGIVVSIVSTTGNWQTTSLIVAPLLWYTTHLF
jgi:hypothetical protein